MTLQCTMVIFCERILRDEESKNFSLINLFNKIEAELGSHVQLETLTTWEFDQSHIGQPIGFQLLLEPLDGGTASSSPVHRSKVEGQRMNVRVNGFQVPSEPGTYRLRAQIKVGEGEWVKSTASQVFELAALQVTT